jgi:hypothetical protein
MVGALVTACGTLPPVDITLDDDEAMLAYPLPEIRPSPLIESPPIEPVEPPEPPPVSSGPTPAPQPVEPAPTPVPVPVPAQPEPVPAPAPAPVPVPAPAPTPEGPTDEQVVAALVADLARYAALQADDVKRELGATTQALTRQRTDANRVRLAMLYTLSRSPQDDQRALQLLETVAKNNGPAPVKALANVLQAQVVERVRAVREEQQKADIAIQKLEALRALERNLMRDRLRSGGGGAGGGGSGSGGGGGGR